MAYPARKLESNWAGHGDSTSAGSEELSPAQRAAQRIFPSHLPVEERLAAIAELSEVRSTESLELLQQAVFLIGVSRTVRSTDRVFGIPKGGEVAGAAARALTLFAEIDGLQFMEELLLDEHALRTIRETIAYGLGATSHPMAFRVYQKALGVSDADVRFRCLLSLRESLERSVEIDLPEIETALHRVSDLLIRRVNELRGGEKDVIVSILSRYATNSIEERMTRALLKGSDVIVVAGVFEVLTRRGSKSARARLLRVFRSHDLPCFLYLLISEELGRNYDDDVELSAQYVIGRYPWSRWIRSLLSESERDRRRAHLGAARSLKNSPAGAL